MSKKEISLDEFYQLSDYDQVSEKYLNMLSIKDLLCILGYNFKKPHIQDRVEEYLLKELLEENQVELIENATLNKFYKDSINGELIVEALDKLNTNELFYLLRKDGISDTSRKQLINALHDRIQTILIEKKNGEDNSDDDIISPSDFMVYEESLQLSRDTYNRMDIDDLINIITDSLLSKEIKSSIVDYLLDNILESSIKDVDYKVIDNYKNLSLDAKKSPKVLGEIRTRELLVLLLEDSLISTVKNIISDEIKSRLYTGNEKIIQNPEMPYKLKSQDYIQQDNNTYSPPYYNRPASNYSALEIISTILQIGGYIIMIIGVIGTIYQLTKESRSLFGGNNYVATNLIPASITALVCFVNTILMLGASEIIKLFINLAKDVREMKENISNRKSD